MPETRTFRMQYRSGDEPGSGSIVPIANVACLPKKLDECHYVFSQRTNQPATKKKQNASGRIHRDRVLAAATPRVSLKGTNFGSSRTSSRLKQFMVAHVDTQNGTIRLYDAEQFTMMPRVEGRVRQPTASETIEENAAIAKKNVADRNVLTQEFGAKKKKQQLNALLQNRVDSSSLEMSASGSAIQSLLDSKAKHITVPQNQPTDDNQGILPPFDLNASMPAEAYPISQLITSEDRTDIYPVTKMFSKATDSDIEGWRSSKQYTEYVLDLVTSTSVGADRKARAPVIAFLDALFKFRRQRLNTPQVGRGKIVETLRLRFVEKFMVESIDQATNKPVRIKTKKTKDQLDLFIIAVAMHASSFALDHVLLMKAMTGMTQTRMKELIRVLGCVRKGNIVHIPLPLTFPKPRLYASK